MREGVYHPGLLQESTALHCIACHRNNLDCSQPKNVQREVLLKIKSFDEDTMNKRPNTLMVVSKSDTVTSVSKERLSASNQTPLLNSFQSPMIASVSKESTSVKEKL
jgi:hypothetical protein